MAPHSCLIGVFVLFSHLVASMHVNQVIRHHRHKSARLPSCTGSCPVRALCERLLLPQDAWADRRNVQGITGFDIEFPLGETFGPPDGLRKHWAFADKHFLSREIAGFKVSRRRREKKERGMLFAFPCCDLTLPAHPLLITGSRCRRERGHAPCVCLDERRALREGDDRKRPGLVEPSAKGLPATHGGDGEWRWRWGPGERRWS